jgi:hypothetical protein
MPTADRSGDQPCSFKPPRRSQRRNQLSSHEAGLVATPTVASPTRPFVEAVEDGRTGLLAATPAQWVDALDRLVTDEALRRRLGEAARREALLRWSPHLQGRRYLWILENTRRHIADRGHRRPDPAWAEVLDEPPLPVALEPYPQCRTPPSGAADGSVGFNAKAPAVGAGPALGRGRARRRWGGGGPWWNPDRRPTCPSPADAPSAIFRLTVPTGVARAPSAGETAQSVRYPCDRMHRCPRRKPLTAGPMSCPAAVYRRPALKATRCGQTGEGPCWPASDPTA